MPKYQVIPPSLKCMQAVWVENTVERKYDTALYYAKISLQWLPKNAKRYIHYSNIGNIFYYKDNLDSAVYYMNKSLEDSIYFKSKQKASILFDLANIKKSKRLSSNSRTTVSIHRDCRLHLLQWTIHQNTTTNSSIRHQAKGWPRTKEKQVSVEKRNRNLPYSLPCPYCVFPISHQ